jgi:hypothetical protein
MAWRCSLPRGHSGECVSEGNYTGSTTIITALAKECYYLFIGETTPAMLRLDWEGLPPMVRDAWVHVVEFILSEKGEECKSK